MEMRLILKIDYLAKIYVKQRMINHNPNNIQVGEWSILDGNEDHPVMVFSMTTMKMFSRVGNHYTPIDTWEVMTYRLKPKE